MGHLPDAVAERMIAAYESGLVKTYDDAARMFDTSPATFNRRLRRYRETGSASLPPRGPRPRKIDDTWLTQHCVDNPDALLRERVDAWEAKSGVKVSIATMSNAMKRIGWTHKKNTKEQ